MTILLVNNVVMESALPKDELSELHREWMCRSNEAEAKNKRLVAEHEERKWAAARTMKKFTEPAPSGYACDEEVGAFWQWLIRNGHAKILDVLRFEQ